MDSREFDAAAKMLANGRSRRQILRLLVCGATGGAAALLASTRATAKPSCRGEGHPCEGNQTCCEGLSCTTSGPGAARRCTAGAATECERDCPPAEQVVVLAVGADIDIEANCALAGDSNRTTCTFTAVTGAVEVASIAVPESLLCAELVGGDFEEVDLRANSRPKGKAKGLKSKKSEGGNPVVTLVLTGEVTTGATATYWCEADGAALIPVTGPGLRCAAAEATPASEVSDSKGAVVVQTYACDSTAAVNWFEACETPTAAATFRLSQREGEEWVEVGTQPTDADGLCHFGQLPPGTYRLESAGGAWCHAESDSVDDQGDVVVKAGARATVWAFYCSAAK